MFCLVWIRVGVNSWVGADCRRDFMSGVLGVGDGR